MRFAMASTCLSSTKAARCQNTRHATSFIKDFPPPPPSTFYLVRPLSANNCEQIFAERLTKGRERQREWALCLWLTHQVLAIVLGPRTNSLCDTSKRKYSLSCSLAFNYTQGPKSTHTRTHTSVTYT